MTITFVISDADTESAFLRRVVQEALRVYREAHTASQQEPDEKREALTQSLAA
ncbi:MAG TPA: hypothetical protein VJR03_06445 [Nitrospira sp.]|nr:hypothetical protein [Nitrospira sp.]